MILPTYEKYFSRTPPEGGQRRGCAKYLFTVVDKNSTRYLYRGTTKTSALDHSVKETTEPNMKYPRHFITCQDLVFYVL